MFGKERAAVCFSNRSMFVILNCTARATHNWRVKELDTYGNAGTSEYDAETQNECTDNQGK
jgi:hypothetical protein